MADEMNEADPPTLPEPHDRGWFTRLMQVFGLGKHPAASGDLEIDDEQNRLMADWWTTHFTLSRDRRERYRIFDEMDTFGLVASVLDLYSEETTQADYDKQRSVWIESRDKKIVQAGEECLRNIRAEDDISAIVREFCKYGDTFRRLIYATGKGVLSWKHVEPYKVHRVQDKFARLIGFREDGKKFRNKERKVSWPWDYVHFRLLGKDAATEYGTSLLEPIFRSWRQLTLAEDAMLMYRLRRAPDRNMVYVDVGDMEEHDAVNYVNMWKKKFRKYEFIDPSSKEYKKQYNPLTPVEDIFMPVRGEQGMSKVEPLAGGGTDPGLVYDIEHFRNVYFAAARVPKAYMGFEGEINAKATLMQQDVRFARTCKRIRRAATYGTRTVIDIHLSLLPEFAQVNAETFAERMTYVVQMSPISYLDEFERLELMRLRYEIVQSMSVMAEQMRIDPKVWAAYVLTDFAKLPDDMVQKLVAKTGQEPMEGVLTQRQRAKIVEDFGEDVLRKVVEPMGTEGYYNIDAAEQKKINEAIHNSPALRKVIGDIAEYYQDDIYEEEMRQRDLSMIPPTSNGVPILVEDDYKDDEEAKLLREDLNDVKSATQKRIEEEREKQEQSGNPDLIEEDDYADQGTVYSGEQS